MSNVSTIPPINVDQEKNKAEIIREIKLPNFLDISDDCDYQDIISSLSFGADKIGNPSSIDYSGFGAIDDGCKRK